jgi:hypothetical protein
LYQAACKASHSRLLDAEKLCDLLSLGMMWMKVVLVRAGSQK